MTTLLPGALIVKEGRALAPIWLAAAISILASARIGMPLGGLFAFVLGVVALGVFSIGHEYANRTLTGLLAQPISRSRLLLSKIVVLVPLIVLLSLIAALVLFRSEGIERLLGGAAGIRGFGALAARPVDEALAFRWQLAIVLLTPLLGLAVAPWLTMVCRHVTAGLVFTLAVPAGLWIAGQLGRAASVDFDFVELEVGSPFAYGPALTLMIAGVVFVSLVAAVHGWKMFAGLEVLDAPRDLVPSIKALAPGATAAARSPGDVNAARVTRQPPFVWLIRKETRLHGLAFAVAGLYAACWIAMSLTRTDSYIAGQSFGTITALYGVFMAMLIGAVSSAEERSMGTADWQILQPYAFWMQWLIKLLTAGALATLLGLALPNLLEATLPLIGDSGRVGPRVSFLIPYAFGGPELILLITLVSFYVSTLCVGGLRALLLTLPFSLGLGQLYFDVQYATWRFVQTSLEERYGFLKGGMPGWWKLPTVSPSDFATARRVDSWLNVAFLVGFLALIVALAFRNSRSAERGGVLARRQIPIVLTYVALAAVIGRGVPQFLEWWLLTH